MTSVLAHRRYGLEDLSASAGGLRQSDIVGIYLTQTLEMSIDP